MRDFHGKTTKGTMSWLVRTLTVALAVRTALCMEWINDSKYTAKDELRENIYLLRYGLNETAGMAYFGIELTEAELIRNGRTWVGFGISDPTSGSMLGADVVTAELSGDDDGPEMTCTITDRYVPFVAYPLLNSPLPFPVSDDCNVSDWKKVNCRRDSLQGVIRFEVERLMTVDNDQDRNVTNGLNRIIYAYGSSLSYHGSSRGAKAIMMRAEKTPDPLPPGDADGVITIKTNKFNVPSDSTVYACTGLVLTDTDERHIVAIEPEIDPASAAHVHHFLLYICGNEDAVQAYDGTGLCDNVFDMDCYRLIYPWAAGNDGFILPEEAGFRVDNDNYIFILQTHYDNPDRKTDIVDSSGVVIHTTSTLRKFDAGSVNIGDAAVLRPGVIETDVKYQGSCPSHCTKNVDGDLTIFASALHMHNLGKEAWTNHFDEDDKFIDTISHATNWNGGFQHLTVFDETITFKPGQSLQMTCTYDVSKQPNARFGIGTTDEMCMDFLFYYPMRSVRTNGREIPFGVCSYGYMGISFTFCGNVATSNILFGKNPTFEDTIGIQDTFGNQASCSSSVATSSPNPTVITSPEPTMTTSPAPTMTASPAPACFAGSMTVELESGLRLSVADLQIGDRVRTGDTTFSDIHLFGHRRMEGLYPFKNITTDRGFHLLVSAGHFVEVEEKSLILAADVRIGTMTSQGVVVSVSDTYAQGLHNPHTLDGLIVVNGFLTSTYTSAVSPKVAHVMLMPVRAIYKLFGVNVLGSFLHKDRANLLGIMSIPIQRFYTFK